MATCTRYSNLIFVITLFGHLLLGYLLDYLRERTFHVRDRIHVCAVYV